MNNLNYEEILNYFSENIKKTLLEYFTKNENIVLKYLEEIRIRNSKPIILKIQNKNIILNYIPNSEDILDTMQRICNNSLYSFQNQICNGYITIRGGHRVGITGNVAFLDEKITNINYISGLNFRIAREIKNCSDRALKYILNIKENNIYNTLIISPPGSGKTTLLRDCIRKISNGIEEIKFKGKTIGVVDERGEIAAMHKGIPQNDIGLRTDILDNIPKHIGMKMIIRSMGPEIIVSDEIGNSKDVDAINYAACCGIKGIFTAHGGTFEDVNLNPAISELLNKYVFERIIFLSNSSKKGEIEKVYALNKKNKEYVELNLL